MGAVEIRAGFCTGYLREAVTCAFGGTPPAIPHLSAQDRFV